VGKTAHNNYRVGTDIACCGLVPWAWRRVYGAAGTGKAGTISPYGCFRSTAASGRGAFPRLSREGRKEGSRRACAASGRAATRGSAIRLGGRWANAAELRHQLFALKRCAVRAGAAAAFAGTAPRPAGGGQQPADGGGEQPRHGGDNTCAAAARLPPLAYRIETAGMLSGGCVSTTTGAACRPRRMLA